MKLQRGGNADKFGTAIPGTHTHTHTHTHKGRESERERERGGGCVYLQRFSHGIHCTRRGDDSDAVINARLCKRNSGDRAITMVK